MYCRVKLSLMMEAVRTSETSVENHFTRQYIPEDNSEHRSYIIFSSTHLLSFVENVGRIEFYFVPAPNSSYPINHRTALQG
jgi:hypothetical protein